MNSDSGSGALPQQLGNGGSALADEEDGPATGSASPMPGSAVWVFYRMSTQRDYDSSRYMPVSDRAAGAFRPRVGMSEGWVPAFVTGMHGNIVSVELDWPWFYNCHGQLVMMSERQNRQDSYQLECVRPRAAPAASAAPGGAYFAPMARQAQPLHLRNFVEGVSLREQMTDLTHRPTLGLVAVRWGGRKIPSDEQFGVAGSPVSDKFLHNLIELGVVPCVGVGRFEVWSVFVEDLSDMMKVADSAHLLFPSHHPIRRCAHVAAGCFLYPTSFDQNSVPTQESAAEQGAGLVERTGVYAMMGALERVGMRSVFPHSSHLYYILASKQWMHWLTLDPVMRCPAAVAITRGEVERDIAGAARTALRRLAAVRRTQQNRGMHIVDALGAARIGESLAADKLKGAGKKGQGAKGAFAALRAENQRQALVTDNVMPAAEAEFAATRGVLKLGFSWEALDVKHWQSRGELEKAMHDLVWNIDISDELTAQVHDIETLILQEFVPHDTEMRLYYVEGSCELVLFTKMTQIKDNDEFGGFRVLDLPGAASHFYSGNEVGLRAAFAKGKKLGVDVLEWLSVENGGSIPHVVRLDMFVRQQADGSPDVRLLEICENGFCMLGNSELPRKVMTAIARHALGLTPAFLADCHQASDQEAITAGLGNFCDPH